MPTPMTLVSTCKAFAAQTLPFICGSLHRAGVTDFHIVGDGFMEPTPMCGHIVQPAPVAGLWDLTALPYAAQLPHEWFFLLSDTCLVNVNYLERISEWTNNWECDLIGLQPYMLMCFMGLYRKTYIVDNLAKIKNCAGMTKHDLVLFENSDRMITWAKRYLHAKAPMIQFNYQEDFYRTGHLRWHRYFGAFGVTKWTIARNLKEIDEHRSRRL